LARNLLSSALVVLLAVALAWGNCLSCTQTIRVETESHGCCDTDEAPNSAPKDCAGKTADFEKAVQQEKSSPVPVLAEAIILTAAAAEQYFRATASDLQITPHSPAVITPLRI
jgi:hypothetical protein